MKIEFGYQECDDLIEALEFAISMWRDVYQVGFIDKDSSDRLASLQKRLLEARGTGRDAGMRPRTKPHISRAVDGNWLVWPERHAVAMWCWRCEGPYPDGPWAKGWGLTMQEAYERWLHGH